MEDSTPCLSMKAKDISLRKIVELSVMKTTDTYLPWKMVQHACRYSYGHFPRGH
jgi:hypothetical protein